MTLASNLKSKKQYCIHLGSHQTQSRTEIAFLFFIEKIGMLLPLEHLDLCYGHLARELLLLL